MAWFGLFAPASPSVTNSGVDVCQFQTGLCLSGMRSMIVFGALLLLGGLWVVYALVRNAGRMKE